MANLTKNAFTGGSAVQTLVAATAGGDTVQNLTRQDYVVIRNGHATLPRTVTLFSEPCNQGHPVTGKDFIIAALTTRTIKPEAPVTRWKDTNGHLQITYSDAAADLTIGAFTMPD